MIHLPNGFDPLAKIEAAGFMRVVHHEATLITF